MPRKAKEEKIENTKTKLTTKKNVEKKSDVKNNTTKNSTKRKSTSNSTVKNKTNKATSKKTNSSKISSVKTSSKTDKTTSKPSTKKATNNKVKRSSSAKKTNKNINVLEYYDLPYRYNETVIKVLAQTPTTLFVYWDISDKDKNEYIAEYGQYFFNNTKPVLIVKNKTKNYEFEVDINDFANSWYLHVSDSNCDYQIELGRRPINNYINIPNNYMYITSSNDMESPNDHILFDSLSKFVYFRNVKNNNISKKNVTNIYSLRKIGKLYNIKDFYEKLYAKEQIDFDRLDLLNPSSK